MNKSAAKRKSVDDYIAHQPNLVINILLKIRDLIKETCPEAIESISYGMPAYKYLGKPLVYFAAFAKHIWLYATPSWHTAFATQLAAYKQWKGSVQFPLTEAVPYKLITEIVRYKSNEIKKANN